MYVAHRMFCMRFQFRHTGPITVLSLITKTNHTKRQYVNKQKMVSFTTVDKRLLWLLARSIQPMNVSDQRALTKYFWSACQLHHHDTYRCVYTDFCTNIKTANNSKTFFLCLENAMFTIQFSAFAHTTNVLETKYYADKKMSMVLLL